MRVEMNLWQDLLMKRFVWKFVRNVILFTQDRLRALKRVEESKDSTTNSKDKKYDKDRKGGPLIFFEANV